MVEVMQKSPCSLKRVLKWRDGEV